MAKSGWARVTLWRDDRQAEQMRISPFLLLIAFTTLSATTIHIVRPMVTIRAIELGASPLEIGLVQSAYSILPVLLAVLIGRAIDQSGEYRFLVVAMILLAVGSLTLGIAGGLVALAFGLSLIGLGQIMNGIASQSVVAHLGPRQERDHRYGWFTTAVSAGQLVGPSLGAAIAGTEIARTFTPAPDGSPNSFVFVFAAAMAGVAFLVVSAMPRERPRPSNIESNAPINLRAAAYRVLRRPGMPGAMLVGIVVVSSVDVLIAYLPALGVANGLSVAVIGALLSARAAASLISRMFMGRLIDRFGRGRLLAGSLAISALTMVGLPFVSDLPVLFALIIAMGLGLGIGQPMTMTWVVNATPRKERALALGVRLTGNRGALLLVPTAMGAVAGALGIAAIWVVSGLFLASGALVATRTAFDIPRRGDRSGAEIEPTTESPT